MVSSTSPNSPNPAIDHITCDQYDPNKLRFCDQSGKTFQQYGKTETPPFRNDFKISGNYPVGWGVEASAVFMSYAGKGNSYTAQDPSLGIYWVFPLRCSRTASARAS